MIGDLLYQFGYTLGGLGAGARGGSVAAGTRPGDTGDAGGTAGTAALGTAAAFLLARLLRPRPVRWHRAMLAGVAATALADLVGRTFEDEPAPGRVPYADDPGELLGRLAAGVAIAAGYAAILYPRLPGPPLVRGLLFGGLEIAAAPRGGLVRLAAATPGLRFPLQALATPIDEDAGPLSHLAFGLGLGLFYRSRRRVVVEEIDEGDPEDV